MQTMSQQAEKDKSAFEIFLSAIELDDNQAWQALYRQYNGLIQHWIAGTTGKLSSTDREDLIQETWTNFYRTLRTYRVSLMQHFKHVGALLNFLKKCTVTATIKHWKRRQRQKQLEEEANKFSPTSYSAHDDEILARIYKEERLKAIYRWREQYLTDPIEKMVFDYCFVKGWMPKELAKKYPDIFEHSKRVRDIKDRIVKRMRRVFTCHIPKQRKGLINA